MRLIKTLIILSLFTCAKHSISQDIRGGMLNISHINSFTYKGTLKLFIDPSISINRPFVLINWDVATDTLFYVFDTPLNAQETQVEYMGTFTYPSNGTYQVVYKDSFRVVSVNNIINSNLEKINLTNDFIINPFIGNNNQPQLFYNPNNIIESNGTYTLNPNIVDSDNDSLFFQLVPSTANGYYYPNTTSINSTSGIITTTPDTLGIYDLTVKVEEYRNSIFIGSTTFEFVININTIVGIEDNSDTERGISIYPIPNNGNFAIELNDTENAVVEVYNTSGQLVLQQSLTQNITPISLTEHPKGMYFVKVRAEKKTIVKKIIYQ